ncbi:dihydrofolate reductase [Metabacillus fastidiosus]|uniref:dihydrofolate reductase n=1 Tax=Metabacillus fastidiosus TaxID=1458 RepID=UPI003D2A236D
MISFIVGMDRNRVIGIDNKLPWHLPADLAFFKRTTMGNPIIMGRKTFESIGKALPGRENVILTRDETYEKEGCTIIHSVDDVEKFAEQTEKEVFIIGGTEIFKQTFVIADRLYITFIDEEFTGDTFFPEFHNDEWELVSEEKGIKDEKNPYDYYFRVYDRKNS